MSDINYLLVLSVSLIAALSPGPATIAIASASMNSGHRTGATTALGISCGSIIWAAAAALGVSAVLLSHAAALQGLRLAGGAYLLFLGWQSFRSVLQKTPEPILTAEATPHRQSFLRGLGIHLTNPKALLFFTALNTVGIPVGATVSQVALLNLLIVFQGALVFQFYAAVFSLARVRRLYFRIRKVFETLFAVVFAGSGLALLRMHFE